MYMFSGAYSLPPNIQKLLLARLGFPYVLSLFSIPSLALLDFSSHTLKFTYCITYLYTQIQYDLRLSTEVLTLYD